MCEIMNHHKQRTRTNACIDFLVYMYNIIHSKSKQILQVLICLKY